MAERKRVDWEACGDEYRAGVVSIRALAAKYGCTDTAIRKKAKEQGWQRALAEKVRIAVKEELVRTDGLQTQRARTDSEIIDDAKRVVVSVVTTHRKDLEQLHGLKRVIAVRLADYLHGGEPDGPFMGDKESPGDLLEKLARVTSRLIPLERQAYSLDDDKATAEQEVRRVVIVPAKIPDVIEVKQIDHEEGR